MRVVLKIEDIGRNSFRNTIIPSQAWAAEIVGFDPKYKFKRLFLKQALDWQYSNSVGSRGIYKYYWLEENKLYEVSSPLSWKKTDKYFCTIANGEIIKQTEGEAETWIYDYLE